MNHLDPAALEQLRPVPGRCDGCGQVALVYEGTDGKTCARCATAPGPEAATVTQMTDEQLDGQSRQSVARDLRAARLMFPRPVDTVPPAEVHGLWEAYLAAQIAAVAAEVALRRAAGHSKVILADGVHVATRCQQSVSNVSWVSDYFRSVNKGNANGDDDE